MVNYNLYFHPIQKMRIKVRVNTMVLDEIDMDEVRIRARMRLRMTRRSGSEMMAIEVAMRRRLSSSTQNRLFFCESMIYTL